MISKYRQFIFEDYSFDKATNTVKLSYSFDGQLKFTETVSWHLQAKEYDPEALDRALFGLWLMAGASYYKAYLAPEIVLKKGQLSPTQAAFFDDIYLNGLSQFFFTNQLDPKLIAKFPIAVKTESWGPIRPGLGRGALLAVGGGKDSIVAAELLNKLGLEYSTWVMYHHNRFQPLLDKIGRPSFGVSRQIDPKLAEINETDAYNGHVPITAIVGFVGVVLAILTNKKSLVWAIESSTDEPHTAWKGLPVNHQYSKSSMFERAMSNYIQENTSPDLEYYSILRPLSELAIAEIFCKNYWDEYANLFSSCNGNFTLGKTDSLSWCGKCPKCAFVFAIFSPFVAKKRLMRLFQGKDLFADEDLTGTFEQMLGIDGIKPLECVGEVAEVRTALQMAKDTGQYPELSRFDFPKSDYDYQKWHQNFIPDPLEGRLMDLLKA